MKTYMSLCDTPTKWVKKKEDANKESSQKTAIVYKNFMYPVSI